MNITWYLSNRRRYTKNVHVHRIYTNTLFFRNYAIFPKRTDDDCVIIYHKQDDPKARNFNFELNVTLYLMQIDAAIYDYPAKGLIYVYDVAGVNRFFYYRFVHFTAARLDSL